MITETTKDANSLLCYGYVDHIAGLTYQTVAATMHVDGDYSIVDTAQFISMKIRAEFISKEDIIPIRNKALFRQYAHIVDNINKFYYTGPDVEICRSIQEIDQFRHADCPDDLQVLFIKEGFRPEAIRVRTSKFKGSDSGTFLVEGTMLNTPHADFGVKSGDTILVGSAIVDTQGTRVCFALLQK